MKILVTGSSGQLGSATIKHLKKQGYIAYGIDIIASDTTNELLDITDKEKTIAICRGFNAIIHTAALHGKHHDLGYSREAFIYNNIIGTLNLLNACTQNGIDRFLYVSTTSIYGDAMVNPERAVWVDELLAQRPRDIYDITKQTAEQLCRDFFYKEGLQTSIYRVARFLPETDNLMLNHRLYRGLDPRDGAEALRLALHVDFKDLEIFNISGGSPFNKDDLYEIKHRPENTILKYHPEAYYIYKDNNWVFPETIDRVYDNSKAERYFNYKPQYTFDYLLRNIKG